MGHLQLLDQLPREHFLVDYQDDERGLVTEMTVVAYDDEKPGLLSKICGVMLAAGVEILSAQVHTLRALPGAGEEVEGQSGLSLEERDIVLDRLQLATNHRALGDAKKAKLAASLRSVLCDDKNVEELLRETGREVKQSIVPQRIAARNDLSDEHSVLTVVSDNTPGLMFALTRAIADIGLDVHTAKITTWGGRAEDAFYVTRRIGGESEATNGNSPDGKISDEAMGDVLRALKEKLQKAA